MNRRDFLKGVGVTAVGAATGAVSKDQLKKHNSVEAADVTPVHVASLTSTFTSPRGSVPVGIVTEIKHFPDGHKEAMHSWVGYTCTTGT
jgi:hypothetical protein